MIEQVNILEKRLLEMFLSGESNVLRILQDQCASVSVQSREFTGVGFFTNLAVGPNVERIPDKSSFTISNLYGSASNVEYGVGFVLFIKNGELSLLEGFSYDGPWPETLKNLELYRSENLTID